MRMLGIDFGEKRIGMAITDKGGKIALPLSVAKDIDEVVRVVKERGVEKIIVGMPLSLKGKRGRMAKKTEVFIEELKKRVDVPVEEWDERFSTKEALRIGNKENKDAIAAAIILQSYIEGKDEACRNNRFPS